MLTAVRCMLSKLVSPLWRTGEVDGEGFTSGTSDVEDIRHLRGSVVTQLCLDYGMIDDAVYFTSGQVLGGMPLKEGDLVNGIAVRDGAQGGWKALRVEKSADAWEDGGKTSLEADCMQLRPLIGTVTSFEGDGGYINQTTYFPRHSLWEGYEPMKGDWVQAKYFINPTHWTTQANSVAPLRYRRLDRVCVTSVFGNKGVVQDSVFFCLDSLRLPAHYQPLPGHLVNLVMVESSQSMFSWRALCMAPCLQSQSSSAARLPDTDLRSLLENKGELDVTEYGQFGDLRIGERQELVLWIQNKGSETHRLKRCDFAGWDSKEQFSLVTVKGSTTTRQKQTLRGNGPESGKEVCDAKELNKVNGDVVKKNNHSLGVRREERELDIPPGERLSVVVACQAKSLGSCSELLLLHFASFTIGRRLEVTVGSEEENLLQPFLPYMPTNTRPAAAIPSQVITVSVSKDTPRLTKRRLPSFLLNYPVPQALKDCVEAQNDVLVTQPCLGEVLSASNMLARFSALLWLEELHAERELREFTISGALLKKGAAYLHLEVNGLAEGRPSLNISDRIVLKKPRSDGVVIEYISYVTEINDESVSLRVNSEFLHSYLGEPLDVEFSYNRTTTRRCHNALHQMKHFGDFLFPTTVTLQPPLWTGKWEDEPDQNKAIGDNEAPALENGKVSSMSVNMNSKATQTKHGGLLSKPIPSKGHFFNPELNPPQREAVKRILEGECRPIPYVLFGPPGTGKTITLIEAILQSIPEVLRLYSRAGEDIRQACYNRIVVSTCSSAGMFHNLGLQVGHFTHVFLDEAGQATEPESSIPMSLVSERDGQIVLAGDPRQLGPIVKSKLAAAFGLGVSLLERLMSNPLYSRHDWGYNPKLVTKLIYNYRSHEALLVLPSKLFYQGELCCKAPRAIADSLCQWKNLPKKGFPLLFHGVRGTEMREGNNPSWFNPVEAVQAMLYCCQLSKKLYNPVNASDIGIIAPYKKQCEKIRVLLGKVGLSDIKVGSVEEFQGQEFLVIIMSTVRSNESVQSDDLQSALGFLANPKRFNVAITRPKALLLIVGNPHILIRDLCFRALLQYCFINGAYLGCDPPPSLRDSQIVAEEQKSA
ncbi:RNA helicase Mov10l1 isoform X2 [Scophthalmus maximus]|uniref:RNA helicase Mov10l1 isoform X2 n=1 Tax=Scophthalmus maximus TaxID=52904 RepID=UPI001FA9296C|nr:RNA helicase Mov10l1 isoform X2 [Scophthalmus maximus]